MIVSSISAVMNAAQVKPLTPIEQKEGKTAFSALLYEYGAQLSASALVVMWLLAVMTPRVIEYLEKRKAEQKPKTMDEAMRLASEAQAHADKVPA